MHEKIICHLHTFNFGCRKEILELCWMLGVFREVGNVFFASYAELWK
jgi:hypothetical protein